MATFGGKNGGVSFERIASVSKTAVEHTSKNGNRYFSFGFSDRSSGKAYTVKVFTNTYTPTNSTKSYRNGKNCCKVIIEQSKMSGGRSGGWGNGGGYNRNSNGF